ncbi:MAG: hypothetical protein ACI906_001227 [Candidatus Latescibacterota bacterium]
MEKDKTEERGEARDTTSIKMFFLVLGAIAAYQLSSWMRGEPEWREFEYAPGAFVAAVVGDPEELQLSEKYSFGEVEFQFLTFVRSDVQYAIAYGDIPATVTADSALVAVREVLVEKMQGEVLETSADSLAGLPARRVQISAADESSLVLLSMWSEGRLYQLMAGGEADDMDGNTDLQHFFTSFRLVVHPH